MKKSTITKLICLALLCLIMVPFVASCGNKITVYFDAGEGTVDETERKVKQGELIGRLPTPKRDGYKFAGWFEEDDMDYQDQIKKTTPVSFTMVLVAKWEEDTSKAQIFFNTGRWGSVEKETLFIDKGTSLGTKLVDPTLSDNNAVFEGWFLDGKKVSNVTVFNENVVLEARYVEPVICTANNTYNHKWTPFDYSESEATCTDDGKAVRYCEDCGYKQSMIGEPALGHDYPSPWEPNPDNPMEQTRECDRCKREVTTEYENLSKFIKSTEISGSVFGANNSACLYNKNWTEGFGSTFSGNNGSVEVKMTFSGATYVDGVFVKIAGSNAYELYVVYAGDTTETKITGNGASGSVAQWYDIDGEITNARFFMANGGTGGDYWQEIAFARIPELED